MLLILGLDGATWKLAQPWVADGTLPHLRRLIDQGAWGPLRSTTPAATFPSWTSFMTGVNPGRHGIFDFSRRDAGSYRVRFVNATYRKAPSAWRLLSDAGRLVCVLGLPGTYPPEPINGYMISGFDTPVTIRADRSFVYPPSFADEIDQLGGFPFAEFQEVRIDAGWHARALTSLLRGIERKASLADELLRRESWDCFLLLLGESDTVAHHFWGLHDPASPRHDPNAARNLGDDPIRTVYRALDDLIGRLRRRVPEATVLLASDHGFGGAGDTAVYINRFLADSGFLAWRRRGAGSRAAGALRDLALRAVPESWQGRLFRLAGGWFANTLETGVRFGGIEWARTRAFSEELNYAPAVWLNVRGREPEGQVPPEEYDRMCAAVTDRLLSWRDPIRGSRIVRQVWRREDLYEGPYVHAAPDLVLDLETPGGYSYVCPSSGGAGGRLVERLSVAVRAGGKLRGMSGSHRPDGLFVLAGEHVRPGVLHGARIWDMAPSILTLCGVAVPAGWDGRVLPCIGVSTEHTGPRTGPRALSEQPYNVGEESSIARQLARLGYLDE